MTQQAVPKSHNEIKIGNMNEIANMQVPDEVIQAVFCFPLV